MLTNICTIDEVVFRFETFMMKQFRYDLDYLRKMPLYLKAVQLVEQETDYWADQSFWNLYDEASLLTSKN
jgi:hypothetical protein